MKKHFKLLAVFLVFIASLSLIACDKTLTYKELNEEANRIANALIEKGVGKGDIVGLMLPRKSYLLSALFGILKTGAAYLPIDPDHPEERTEYMLSKSIFAVSGLELVPIFEPRTSLVEQPTTTMFPATRFLPPSAVIS